MRKIGLWVLCILLLNACVKKENSIPSSQEETTNVTTTLSDDKEETFEITNEYLLSLDMTSGLYVVLNNNVPFLQYDSFEALEEFEVYSELDEFGRCGVAYANISLKTMPTEERGNIGMVKPSGWQVAKYESVEGRYLYNRCHLIGFQLAGENANKDNLITCTRSMNTKGMLPFENQVANYVKQTGNHVLYRITPIFKGQELVARGVQMEALSVEDQGEGVKFHVFVFNTQPGIEIDYETGNSKEKEMEKEEVSTSLVWISSKGGTKYHSEQTCSNMEQPLQINMQEALDKGYTPCGKCMK